MMQTRRYERIQLKSLVLLFTFFKDVRTEKTYIDLFMSITHYPEYILMRICLLMSKKDRMHVILYSNQIPFDNRCKSYLISCIT